MVSAGWVHTIGRARTNLFLKRPFVQAVDEQ